MRIERKAKMEEFLGNIGSNWERFKRELDKLSEFEKPAIMLDTNLAEEKEGVILICHQNLSSKEFLKYI